MNIKFYNKLRGFFSSIVLLQDQIIGFLAYCITALSLCLALYSVAVYSSEPLYEPVQACVVAREQVLTDAIRAKFAQCLGWNATSSTSICHGSYSLVNVAPLSKAEEIRIMADKVSFYQDKRSVLRGNVEVQEAQRIVNADTAYVYRDAKTNKVTKIVFVGDVRFIEPDKLMIARRASINPVDKSGQTEDVLYRFKSDKKNALLPAWGRASLIQRFPNQDYLLRSATYTTCAPQDKAWDIEAKTITIDKAHGKAVARNAKLRIHGKPVLYLPYMSFPTSRERKSGFLLPNIGYSNVGGLDLGLPYYWNIAPNYDLTVTPHLFSERGVMVGGQYRFLTRRSFGKISGTFLPHDKAFSKFLSDESIEFPWLNNNTTNRWSYGILESTHFGPNLQLNINMQQVSDDYYLQDFSTNLAVLTQRQLLRQADVTYTTEHWQFRGMGQNYQTLHPVNESPIANVYARLPQLLARGYYYELPLHANVNILGQYDQFHWPTEQFGIGIAPLNPSQGPRFHFNPILSLPQVKPWGFVTPAIQFVENYYSVENRQNIQNYEVNKTIPRYSVDSGLYFERDINLFGGGFTQTLEPRLFYLNVPYQNQTTAPIYDSGYMIFNMDQLFRTNRFSGFDRIGDTNQLSYALTSRWLAEATGAERAVFSVGQIKYFSTRRVKLCQSVTGYCVDDPYALGNLSSVSETSPIASRAVYNLNQIWGVTGDYIWDPATNATNNGALNLHYQPEPNRIVSAGLSYLVNGDMTQLSQQGTQNNALYQATTAFTWPVNDRWSAVGAYAHNISKNYSMMSLVGLQYDSCCWAVRALGGRTFKSLSASYEPQYNNNIYLQVVLKGLGSLANSDPANILRTYIPGYNDPYQR